MMRRRTPCPDGLYRAYHFSALSTTELFDDLKADGFEVAHVNSDMPAYMCLAIKPNPELVNLLALAAL